MIVCLFSFFFNKSQAQVYFLEGLNFIEIDPSNLGYNISSFKNEMPKGDTLGLVWNSKTQANDTLIFNVEFEEYFNNLLLQNYFYNENLDKVKVIFKNIDVRQIPKNKQLQTLFDIKIAYIRKTSQGYSEPVIIETFDTLYSIGMKTLEEQLSYAIENNFLKYNNLDRKYEDSVYQKMLTKKFEQHKRHNLRAPLISLQSQMGLNSFESNITFSNPKYRDKMGFYFSHALGIRRFHNDVLNEKNIIPSSFLSPFYKVGLGFHHKIMKSPHFFQLETALQVGVESFEYINPADSLILKVQNIYSTIELSQSLHFFLEKQKKWILAVGFFENYSINSQALYDVGVKMSLSYHFN